MSDLIDVKTGNVVRRPVAGWLTYNGDQSHMVGEVKGPSYMNEWLTAIHAEYDPETDTTRVGFAYGILVRQSEATS